MTRAVAQIDEQSSVTPVLEWPSAGEVVRNGHWRVHWIPRDAYAGARTGLVLAAVGGVQELLFRLEKAGAGAQPYRVAVQSYDGETRVTGYTITWDAVQGADVGEGIEFYFNAPLGLITVSGATAGNGQYSVLPWSSTIDGPLQLGNAAGGSINEINAPGDGWFSEIEEGYGDPLAAQTSPVVAGVWSNVAIGGGYSGALVDACAHGGAVFFCGESAEIQRRQGPLGTFESLAPGGAYSGALFSIASNGRVILASGVGAFYRSDDAGDTWSQVAAGAYGNLIYSLAAHAGDTFFAGGVFGVVLVSTDAGLTWSESTSDGSASYTTAVSDGSTVVVAGSSATVRRSDDGGSSWAYGTLADGYGGDFLGSCAHNGYLYLCGTGAEIQRSANGFASAVSLTVPAAFAGDFYAIASDGADLVVVGSGGEIMRSSDDGVTWQRESADGDYTGYLISATAVEGVMMVGGESGELQASGEAPALYSVPGLLMAHDSGVAGSVVANNGGNISDWRDLTGLRRHLSAGTAPELVAGEIVFAGGGSEYLQYVGEALDALIGSRPFVVAIRHGGGIAAGCAPAVPRLYLESTVMAYDGLAALSYGDQGAGVSVWGHDGTSLFYRHDGAQIASATVPTEALAGSFGVGRVGSTYMTGTVTQVAMVDASAWGADFASHLAAVEAALGVT